MIFLTFFNPFIKYLNIIYSIAINIYFCLKMLDIILLFFIPTKGRHRDRPYGSIYLNDLIL